MAWPYGQGKWATEDWTDTGVPVWGTARCKSLWECPSEEPLPDSEGDWNGQADLLTHSLEGATWVYAVSRHVGGAAMQMG